MTAHGRK